MKKVPVFFIDGFLDSGKTTFIIDTLKSDIGEDMMRTLLLVCEEGEVEYTEDLLEKTNTVAKYFDSIEAFDYKLVSKYIKEVKPDRIVIEMNGMWDLKALQFPREIEIVQVVTFIDGSTFDVYFNNMRQKFTDIIKQSQICCFTKLDDPSKILPYQTALKLISNRCQFMVMDKDMRASDLFEEPLPYDIEAPVIQIKDEDYGTFYIDTFDHKERYDGKIVEYDTMVVLSDKLPPNTFIGGRMIMNCCANDVQLYGFLVKSRMGLELKDRCFVHMKAKVSYDYVEEYQEEELQLEPISIEIIPDKEQVLNLTA